MKLFIICSLITFNSCLLLANTEPCLFCSSTLLNRQSVFESEYFIVLVDYAPITPGHLLIIPKRHSVKAHELLKEEWEEFSLVIKKVVQVFSDYPGTDQYVLLEKNGPDAFQHVPHVHFHMLPMKPQSKLSLLFYLVMRFQLSSEDLKQEVLTFREIFSKRD
jgi:diadenosine tetraphosphate (Ap4A) HIT family hydrolase